jgi:hypothetical protein
LETCNLQSRDVHASRPCADSALDRDQGRLRLAAVQTSVIKQAASRELIAQPTHSRRYGMSAVDRTRDHVVITAARRRLRLLLMLLNAGEHTGRQMGFDSRYMTVCTVQSFKIICLRGTIGGGGVTRFRELQPQPKVTTNVARMRTARMAKIGRLTTALGECGIRVSCYVRSVSGDLHKSRM